ERIRIGSELCTWLAMISAPPRLGTFCRPWILKRSTTRSVGTTKMRSRRKMPCFQRRRKVSLRLKSGSINAPAALRFQHLGHHAVGNLGRRARRRVDRDRAVSFAKWRLRALHVAPIARFQIAAHFLVGHIHAPLHQLLVATL